MVFPIIKWKIFITKIPFINPYVIGSWQVLQSTFLEGDTSLCRFWEMAGG